MNMSKFFKQIKRISLVSLSLTIILSSFVFGVPTAAATDSSIWNGSDLDADFEGSGTESDPYQINSAAEQARGYRRNGRTEGRKIGVAYIVCIHFSPVSGLL